MKTQLCALSSALLFSVFPPLTSHAAEKHVHGLADLFIAIEGNQVLIEFESPADNIIGFEHAPRTDAQKTAVVKATQTLQKVSRLIKLEEGGCKQVDAFVESPFANTKEEHHDHEEHAHEEDHDYDEEHAHMDDHNKHDEEHTHKEDHYDEEKETHSEFHVTYTLECKNSKSIKTANITAFSYFTNFQEIVVNWVTSEGQGSQKTTPKKTKVNFK